MILFLDTSALVPLLIAEPATKLCRTLWQAAGIRAANRLAYVEAAAALAQAERLERLTPRAQARALHALDRLFERLTVIEAAEPIISRAAALAHSHALRGYDAVHCATALALGADDLVAASGDRRLLDAWSALGLTVADVNGAEVAAD